MEAFPKPLEPERGADAEAAHPFPRGQEHPREPGVQFVLGLSRGCAGEDRPGIDTQEGEGAEEREHLLHDLPDLHVGG